MSWHHRSNSLRKQLDKLNTHPKESQSEGKAYYSVGIELVASLITSMFVAWGIGTLFTFSHLWRVILGIGLGLGSNLLILYKLLKLKK